MKTSLLITISLLACGLAKALPDGQTLANINWDDLINGTPQGLQLPPHVAGTIDNPTNSDDPSMLELKIRYSGTSSLQLKLLPTPFGNQSIGFQSGVRRIVTHHYAITGEVRYENVSPGSYLEMWSYFASPAPGYPEGAFFSRAVADGGPMGGLDGTSDWREFWLPFDSTSTTAKLNRLEMNLHLTGPGTVHLRKMKLMQYPDSPALAVHVPPAPAASAGRTVVQIAMTPGNSAPVYSIDGKSYPDIAAIQQGELAARHTTDPEMQVVIQADKSVPYDSIRAALDAVSSVGVAEPKFEVAPASEKASSPAVGEAPTTMTLEQVGESVTKEETRALKIIWFCLGMFSTAVLLFAGVTITFVSRLWQRRQHERELRRMASLDS